MLSNTIKNVQFETREIVRQLIDIFWSDIYNAQVIEETYHFLLQNDSFPEPLKRYFEQMGTFQKNGKFSPFLIIEPYGEVLESLEPAYFDIQRRVYYQEDCSSLG